MSYWTSIVSRQATRLLIASLATLLPFLATTAAAADDDAIATVIKGMPMRAIGPAFMGGRISHITVHPEEPRTWYVAVGSGGVWKTTNAGTTFEPIFDDQGSYSIGTVTIDPSSPERVWVGTGAFKDLHTGHLGAHVFETPGTFTVLLRVTDTNGVLHDYSQTINVTDPEVVYGNSSNTAGGTTIYVSPSGDDSANGSFNSPVATAEAGFSRLFDGDGPRRLLFERGGIYPTDGFRTGGILGGPL